MSWAYDSVTCIFLLEQCHVWPTLCECASPGVDSDFLDKREETQRFIDIVQESTVRPFYMIRTQSSKLKAKCTCCRRQGSHVRDWQGDQGDCFEPKLIFMPIHWFQTGIMEYETYETEAPYDDMDDQVTKGKVWRFVIFNLGGNMSPQHFLIQKVKPERIANSGESKAEKENWVKSQTLFFSLDFFSAREESSGWCSVWTQSCFSPCCSFKARLWHFPSFLDQAIWMWNYRSNFHKKTHREHQRGTQEFYNLHQCWIPAECRR